MWNTYVLTNEIFTHLGHNNLSQEKTPNFLPLCTSQKKMSLFVSNFQIVINISYGYNLKGKKKKSKFQLIIFLKVNHNIERNDMSSFIRSKFKPVTTLFF